MEKIKKDWGTWYFNIGFAYLLVAPNSAPPEIGHFQNDTNDTAMVVSSICWLLLIIGGVIFYHTFKDDFRAIKSQKSRRILFGVITVILFQVIIPIFSIGSAALYAKLFL